MTAIVVMGLAAAPLLGGALIGALGNRSNFAEAPALMTSRLGPEAAENEGRGDRAINLPDVQNTLHSAVQIEQLSDTGSVRPFTRVSARLAWIDLKPREEQDSQHAETREGSNHDGAPTSNLPPLIVFGTSSHSLPRKVSAYAADQAQLGLAQFIGQPLNVTVVPKSPISNETQQHIVVARAGDTLSSILHVLAVPPEDFDALLAVFPRRRWFGEEPFSGGEIVTIIEGAASLRVSSSHVLKLEVKDANSRVAAAARTDAGRYVQVESERAGATHAQSASDSEDSDLHSSSGETLSKSLHALAQSYHFDEGVISELLRLCVHDFDLDQPLTAADTAEILYAPTELGAPELVSVRLTAQGKTKRYYHFKAEDDGSTDYYDESGHSITKFLLRRPVSDGRLGDGFGWRVHPVLHDRRFHEGVDYAAPYGSPIAAAGAGVVEIIGHEWGYGKYIRIRHDLGYETAYAHVAGFPAGLKVGDRVRQGETIAYVGSTGLSTGPHLYYEVWINGSRVNPLRIKLAGGRVLQGDILQQFRQSARQIDRLMDASADTAGGP